MRETFDQMAFVDAAFAVTIIATLLLVWLSWRGMARAEKRRDIARGKTGASRK